MLDLLGWSSAGLAVATLVFVVVLVARRLRLAGAERRRAEVEHRLRPFALALLEGDPPPALHGVDEAEIFAALVARYSARVRGEARTEVARFFEASGAVDASIAALGGRRAWRRATAAYALGDMASPLAVPALLRALSDPARSVRAAAARSLGALGATDAVAPLVRALVQQEVPNGVAGHALLELGDAAVPSLRELVANDDPDLREAAIRLLGVLGSPADAELLVEALRDASAGVRAGTARALGRLAAAEAADALGAALADRIPFVRAAAATAVGEIGDAGSAESLFALASNDAYEPAQAAARALGRIDPELLVRAARVRAEPHVAEFADRLAVNA